MTAALKRQDYTTAGDAKSKIEDEQRAIHKEREARGEVHEPSLFVWDDEQERWVMRDLDARVNEIRKNLKN